MAGVAFLSLDSTLLGNFYIFPNIIFNLLKFIVFILVLLEFLDVDLWSSVYIEGLFNK